MTGSEHSKNRHLSGDTGLSANMEDYMETIIILSRRNRVVRVKDIARELGITMPSVTAALAKLKELGLIDYEKYGHIELTERGTAVGTSVYGRHSSLTEFFAVVLGLPDTEAEAEACRVEHDLSPETAIRIQRFLSFYADEVTKGSEWIDRLRNSMK